MCWWTKYLEELASPVARNHLFQKASLFSQLHATLPPQFGGENLSRTIMSTFPERMGGAREGCGDEASHWKLRRYHAVRGRKVTADHS